MQDGITASTRPSMAIPTVCLVGIAIMGCMGPGMSGGPIQLDGALACSDCAIGFDSVTTIEGVEFIGPSSVVALSSTKELYMANPDDRLLLVYDTRGRLVRQIGKPGAGPGEYEQVRNVILSEDGTVHVLDGVLARHTVFDASGAFRWSRPIVTLLGGYGTPALLLANGDLLVNARPRAPDDPTAALLRIDSSGGEHSIDEQVGLRFPRRRWLSDRVLSHTPEGGVLAARPYGFAVDLYTSDLLSRRTIQFQAAWIPSEELREPPSDGFLDQPLTQHIQGAWLDDQGLLWLYMILPSPSWTPGPEPSQAGQLSPNELRLLQERELAEALVVVVDLDQRVVLAQHRSRIDLGVSFSNGYFAANVLTAGGEPGVRISRVFLNKPKGGR